MPEQQGLRRRQHAVGAPQPVVVGDVVERAGILAALDLGDRQPPQYAAAEQFEVGSALVEGAQPRTLAAQVFLRNGAQGVGFGRALFLTLPLLGGAGSPTALGLAQRPGGKLAGRRQRQRRGRSLAWCRIRPRRARSGTDPRSACAASP